MASGHQAVLVREPASIENQSILPQGSQVQDSTQPLHNQAIDLLSLSDMSIDSYTSIIPLQRCSDISSLCLLDQGQGHSPSIQELESLPLDQAPDHIPPLVQGHATLPFSKAVQQVPLLNQVSGIQPRSQVLQAWLNTTGTGVPIFQPCKLITVPEPDASLQILQSLLSITQPPAERPNLSFDQPLFDPNDTPASAPILHHAAWASLLCDYPNREVVKQALGAIKHGVVLGYEGPLVDQGREHQKNLPMEEQDINHVRMEIEDRLKSGRLQIVEDPSQIQLVCSPIGAVPKPGSSKLRTIHHLSHPRSGDSVNSGIGIPMAAISYESLASLCQFIADNPGAKIWKADLREAFRSVIIGSKQSRLLGFSFEGKYYMERALSFGGRSSPRLFNVFAELLHWLHHRLLAHQDQYSDTSHYLDDFFGASDHSADAYWPVYLFQLLCEALGFSLSPEKVFWGSTKLTVLGIELDSIAQTASISLDKKNKLIGLCKQILTQKKASLLDMQKIAGHLQFVVQIAPHGKAFMRRLYDGVRSRYKHPHHQKKISKEIRRELEWWSHTLSNWNGVTLLQPSPLKAIHIWTDACPRGLGAHLGSASNPSQIFYKEVSRRHRNKSIHFLETLAVLEAIRLFTINISPSTVVVLHVDNEALRAGLMKGSIDDPITQVLFREIYSLSLLRDFQIRTERVSSAENKLADALSRHNFHSILQEFPLAHLQLQCMQQRSSSSPTNPSKCQSTLQLK